MSFEKVSPDNAVPVKYKQAMICQIGKAQLTGSNGWVDVNYGYFDLPQSKPTQDEPAGAWVSAIRLRSKPRR